MTTTIQSNGSKWAGQEPDSIEKLLDVLDRYALDRTFEAYGNFIMPHESATRFWGNFLELSHVFSIDTDEPELIEQLTKAIRANQQRSEYLDQPPHFDRNLVGIEHHRFSTTQGEVTLTYDGRKLGRFGDSISINGRGNWEGRRDQHWIDCARQILRDQHAAERAKLKAA